MREGEVKKKTKEVRFDRMEVLRKSNEGIITRHKSSVSSKTATDGITLIALVITIVLNRSYLAMERMLNEVNILKI